MNKNIDAQTQDIINNLQRTLNERTKERDAFEMQLRIVSGMLDGLRFETGEASKQITKICETVIETQQTALVKRG